MNTLVVSLLDVDHLFCFNNDAFSWEKRAVVVFSSPTRFADVSMAGNLNRLGQRWCLDRLYFPQHFHRDPSINPSLDGYAFIHCSWLSSVSEQEYDYGLYLLQMMSVSCWPSRTHPSPTTLTPPSPLDGRLDQMPSLLTTLSSALLMEEHALLLLWEPLPLELSHTSSATDLPL